MKESPELVGTLSSQPPGSRKTTTSPRSGFAPNHGVNLSTSTRSPIARVCSIEPEGMEKACTKKVLMPSESSSAITSRIGSSCQNGRFFRGRFASAPARPSPASSLSPDSVLCCTLIFSAPPDGPTGAV